MFLTSTPEGKIYKELATDHFPDPTGLGKSPRPRWNPACFSPAATGP